MQNKIIITCFCYNGNRRYMFNPDYLRSDLRRIISFILNKIGCLLNNITILTDLSPQGQIVDEIRIDFQDEVEDYLRDMGYRKPIIRTGRGGIHLLEWLHKICREASKYLDKSERHLFRDITQTILPIIRSSNAIEFASLFTNFVVVNGKYHYEKNILDIFGSMKSGDNLFFYYTGHGVRFIDSRSVRDICLVIPFHGGTSEFYSKSRLQQLFNKIPEKTSSFVVFDCCHSEKLLELPYQINFSSFGYIIVHKNKSFVSFNSDIIYLASTQNDQTCGFYINKEECGSVFTYYLLDCLENFTPENFSVLYDYVENKVQEYRSSSGKPAQNMGIFVSRRDIRTIPPWLFDGRNISKQKKGYQFDLID